MKRKQLYVAVAIALGAFYVSLLLRYGSQVIPPGDGETLAAMLPWLAWPVLALVLGVVAIAVTRFFDPNLIDGDPPPAGSRTDINRRYLQNTLEQTILAVLAFVALSVQLPEYGIAYWPALCVSFFVTRMCFWIGYHISPPLRAFGFAGTFLPTLIALYLALELTFSA